VVGGMLFAPVLILLVLPVLIDTFSQRTPVHSDESRDGDPEDA
jgi:Cu/Ag efflux pump CusA